MKQYKNINNLVGWLTFIIAAVVYCTTIEPTASFWDCPEFITTGYKLEIGHPPGAPFFMLVANFFTQFTSDTAKVAMLVNTMSALMSAFCILFLFWSITHLVRKLILSRNSEVDTSTGVWINNSFNERKLSLSEVIIIIGSGLVGALAYTFSDTFWFSAVEGEVYAFSSLFTAVVFWLILKWENVADQNSSDKWIILIAYLMGLSIGVHLLNLLCVPAIVLVYYYKKNKNASLRGSLVALVGSGVLIAAVLYGIVPGVVKVGGWFELFFVNTLHFSFNTGVIVYLIVLSLTVIYSIYESMKNKSKLRIVISFLLTIALTGIPFYGHGVSSIIIGIIILAALAFYLLGKVPTRYQVSARTINTSLLCILMILIGYSSYALIVIRSTANTPMDQNSPEDIFTLGEYLGREQYGTRPLFYGKAYSSKLKLVPKDGFCEPVMHKESKRYIRKTKTDKDEKDQYLEVAGRVSYEYAQNMFFPRMYSEPHANQYKSWVDIKGKNVPYDQCGEMKMVNIPTQLENIKFFFSYQLNFMYWRYFMWNFVGRQNDIQGSGEIEHGNWITGIDFIDNILVGNQELLPSELKNNKGRNVYFALPLLLGLIGLFWQANRGKKGIEQFWVVFFLFFMTGIAIVLYLNQTPSQPRERDYAYAGSFYAFAIWIGMGVAGLSELIRHKLKQKELTAGIAAVLLGLIIPIQMAAQNWDDHDRSNRYVCRDFGQNYLVSTQEAGNPIIYTNGDNDTFPLWYNQETEGFRTDVRTCNLSYLQTDWYIDQMKRPAYDSPSLPITWHRSEYSEGNNDYIPIKPQVMGQLEKLYAEAKAKTLTDNGNSDVNPLKEIQDQFGENPYELKNILRYWVRGENTELHMIPTDSIVVKINKEAVRKSGMLIPNGNIPEYMHISLKGKRALYKSELMMLEMIANANWERPIYTAITVGQENRLNLDDHFIQEGLAYRLTPFNSKKTGVKLDTEKMYDNLMNKFKFGGIDTKGIYLDENTMRMCYTHRRLFTQLVDQLLKENKKDKALKALTYAEEKIPSYNVPYDFYNGALNMAVAYYKLGKKEKADSIMDDLANRSIEFVSYYLSLTDQQLAISQREFINHIYLLDEFIKKMKKYNSSKTKHYSESFNALYKAYISRVGEK